MRSKGFKKRLSLAIAQVAAAARVAADGAFKLEGNWTLAHEDMSALRVALERLGEAELEHSIQRAARAQGVSKGRQL